MTIKAMRVEHPSPKEIILDIEGDDDGKAVALTLCFDIKTSASLFANRLRAVADAIDKSGTQQCHDEGYYSMESETEPKKQSL